MIDIINLKKEPESLMEFGRGVEVLSSQNLTFCILPNLSIMLRFGEYGGRNKRLIPSSAALSFTA